MNIHLQTFDCIAGMSELPIESVDLVVTSPPYNLGIKYGSYDDTATRKKYLEWFRRVASNICSVLKPAGSFFLNVGSSPSNPYLPFDIMDELRKHFVLQNTIHWIKSITISTPPPCNEISVGHFKPINSPRFLTDCHEYLFHLTKTGSVPINRLRVGTCFADKSNLTRGTRGKNGDRRCRGNNVFLRYDTIQKRATDRPHPATFPVSLPEYCIRLTNCDREDAVMVDPFVGIGSSAIAAQNLGVGTFYGFDIDADYINKATQRIQ